ncbi:MAG: winged helix-turn-helix domain-containing protein [Thermoplasmata archaeon]|nr:winged helix-turn-helix domain-containing protein [Candidatus Sysuiplasma acidicola]MBX8646940.1 winged helix-turn-helix domain-containing protein [Candidatus Sysuiplasma acidicola]
MDAEEGGGGDQKEFGVEYNVTHFRRVLRDMGFSSQVPQLVSKE